MPRKKSNLKRLRALRAAGEITAAEYKRLARGKRVSRKQRTAALRNLRRACKSIDGSKKTRSPKRGDKLSRKVDSLQSEINSIVRRERLKQKLRKLKEERRALRSAMRSKSSEGSFLLGSAQY